MDYSKTVNLPKTDFPMKANLPQREPEFLKRWEDISIYQKLQEKNKESQKYIFHDGPPYANGHIHIGTALNKILKDFIIKYKSMSGYNCPYTPGWDCHGLPIEQQCMKELKVDKHKVDRLEFRKQAAEFAKRFVSIQRNEFKRLGVFGDWEMPYLTLNHKYEGVIVRVFGDLVKGGYIFRQKKPVYWCPTCETALADAEVEYADHISHSVYVKFKVIKFPDTLKDLNKYAADTSVLIWTTTPWTLPANVALAFQAEADYILADMDLGDGRIEKLIISKKLLPIVAEKIGAKGFNIVKEFSGLGMEGIKCENPIVERESVGILADFVSLEDGTGVVHIAPGHGQDDYQAGLKYGLPVISPVNDRGVFTDEVKEFAGHKVFAANRLIIDKLKNENTVLFEEQMSHSYPHCWRCKKAIIFRATPQWFLKVEHNYLRKRMIEIIKHVKWIPSYGQKRIGGMVEVRPDWCLSRQRLWGVPIPVFYCDECNEPLIDEKLISHISELFSIHGSDIWFEKSSEEIIGSMNISCSKCGKTKFRKEDDILDVWFDSGVSNEAVLASGDYAGLSWPADLYLEGSDQHRGWFQTSLIPSVALRDKAPYKAVLTHGFVVDGAGKKMSKSVGNVIAPNEIISKYGADILRLWTATSDYREDIRISPEIIKGLVDTYRKIRNTFRFMIGNMSDSYTETKISYDKMREIDLFALHRLEEVSLQVRNAYENFEFHKAIVAISNYCTVFMSGFYLDTLKDTLYCDGKEWDSRRSAQSALWEISSVLVRLLAPVLSYTSEEVWLELSKKDPYLPESVFLADFPSPSKNKLFSEEMKNKWEKLLQLREKSMQELEVLRKDKKIGSNLDARIELHVPDGIMPENIETLNIVLGTWDIEIFKAVDPGSVNSAIEVFAKVSVYNKCDRCWRHLEDVKEGSLCPRCEKAVAEIVDENKIKI